MTSNVLTSDTLSHWQQWYEQVIPQLEHLSQCSSPKTYWVYSSRHRSLEFYKLHLYSFNQVSISKVSKLKVGDAYRKDVQGWIVPDELVADFHQCLEVSRLYTTLRRQAIDLSSKLPQNGYQRVKMLTPEKMQALIDIFS